MAKLGIKCKLYRNTATWGSPTWSEVKDISDFQQNVAADKLDVSTRASLVKRYEKGMLELSWTGKLLKGSLADATNLAALLAAIPSQSTTVDLMILDGASDSNGSVGYRGECKIFGGNESQNPGDPLFVEIEIAPAPETAASQPWQSVLVSAGAPVLTTLAP